MTLGNSLVVQWLGLRALTAEGPDSLPGRRTKIPQVSGSSQKIIMIILMTLGGTLERDWRWSPVKLKRAQKALPPGKANDLIKHAKEVLMIKTLDPKAQWGVQVGEHTDVPGG